jgi:hypothetical protein
MTPTIILATHLSSPLEDRQGNNYYPTYLAMNCIIDVGFISLTTSWSDPCSYLIRVPKEPSKTIGPPGKPEGNTTHRVHYAVSPEMDLWVTAMLK